MHTYYVPLHNILCTFTRTLHVEYVDCEATLAQDKHAATSKN